MAFIDRFGRYTHIDADAGQDDDLLNLIQKSLYPPYSLSIVSSKKTFLFMISLYSMAITEFASQAHHAKGVCLALSIVEYQCFTPGSIKKV